MLTSKKLIELTGISRATLNNYINLGILPKPVVGPSRGEGAGAPRIGYFPGDAPSVIKKVDELKRSGLKIAEIAPLLKGMTIPPLGLGALAPPKGIVRSQPGLPVQSAVSSGLRLALDQIDGPAYFVNNRFEIEWINDAARGLLRVDGELSSEIAERGLFSLLLSNGFLNRIAGGEDALRFHVAIAKKRLPAGAFRGLGFGSGASPTPILLGLYEQIEPVKNQPLLHLEINLGAAAGPAEWRTLYASFFREGIFFLYAPATGPSETLAAWLGRRDLVIRDLLKRRQPYLTQLSVLVADLQDSVRICSELPPEEYFELINQIWGAMESTLRKYCATRGRHAGDGILYYFFPQPDQSHVLNAIACAWELKREIAAISQIWRVRKSWDNDLTFNIGLDEGHEWFGTYQTPTHLEFTVLGDTVNRAARLSDFARDGAVWITKSMLGALLPSERQRVRFGIRRKSANGQVLLVPSTFARMSSLVELAHPKFQKFGDVAGLSVTEVLEPLTAAETKAS